MKTQKELEELKTEVETLNKKLAELSEEELAQVAGGLAPTDGFVDSDYDIVWKKDDDEVRDPLEPGTYYAPINFR